MQHAQHVLLQITFQVRTITASFPALVFRHVYTQPKSQNCTSLDGNATLNGHDGNAVTKLMSDIQVWPSFPGLSLRLDFFLPDSSSSHKSRWSRTSCAS